MNPTRQHVLRCYKQLLRTRLVVFKGEYEPHNITSRILSVIPASDPLISYIIVSGDEFAIRESQATIREAFEKNRNETDEERITKVSFSIIRTNYRHSTCYLANFATISPVHRDGRAS